MFETFLFDEILWHDKFVIIEACLVFGGRHIIVVLDLPVCHSLMRAADQEAEDDNYMPPSEDEASLDDNEFVVPEDSIKQERSKHRLMATASSLKKKQQQLRADQDLLADRWTEVLAAEEYELECPSKSYPKRRLLPRLEEEALKPTSPALDTADQPPHGRDREASRPSTQAAPRCNPYLNMVLYATYYDPMMCCHPMMF